MEEPEFKVALIGNPNSGKTSIFNQLTGLRQKVGNFPGVTVEKKEGLLSLPNSQKIQLIDFPGAYSFYPTSLDEKIAVQTFVNKDDPNYPDAVVYIADITNLERHMLLLTQIKELGIPLILALNMSDIADREGINIRCDLLEKKLQMPVVKVSGRTGSGIDSLRQAIEDLLYQPDQTRSLKLFYAPSKEESEVIEGLQASFQIDRPYRALLLAHHANWLPFLSTSQKQQITRITQKAGFESLKFQVRETMARYDRFLPMLKNAIQQKKKESSMTDRIDNIATHRILGPILFILLLFIIFQAIFAWAQTPMEWIESLFNLLAQGVNAVLPEQAWYTRLITEGVLAGLSGILIFVPQIAILFFLIGLLEEAGYMARAVFIFDRIMQKFGLNGRSIVALVSGGACAIPAIMSARTISNWKERLITILVTPLISCSARIPIYIVMVALVVPQKSIGPFNLQGLVFAGLYFLGAIAALGSAWVFKIILKNTEQSFLMIELPPYRLPQFRNVLLDVKEKTLTFITEAGKIIFVIAIVLWFLASFGPQKAMENASVKATAKIESAQLSGQEAEDLRASYQLEASWAGQMGKAIEPAIEPLGFDWKMGIALITSFAAREVFVGTMATLYSIGSEEDEFKIKDRLAKERDPETGEKVYNFPTVLSLLIFYAFAMQCMSTLAVVRKETGGWKWPVVQFVFMTALAYLSSLVVYQALV